MGNIRTTVTEQWDTANYKASMETGQNAKESAMFKRVAETRMLISGVNGHPPPDALTNPNQYTSAIGFDHTHSYGTTTTLKVMAGDTIQIGTKVWLKPRPAWPFDPYGDYEGADMGNVEWIFSALMPIVSGQLAGLSGKITAGQLTNNTSWYNYYSMRSILGNAINAFTMDAYNTRDVQKPAVGFNYILLDEQFNYVPEGSGFMDAENNATLQTLATGLMVVKKSGYLTVTTVVGTPSFNAYFDNLSILHRSGPLLQESDTYAFGGGIDALESRSFGRAENKYGYNGKEKQPDLGLEWLDYGARMYDAQKGRWDCVDPLADKMRRYSPYNYAFDNPLRFVDPDGMAPYEYDEQKDGSYKKRNGNPNDGGESMHTYHHKNGKISYYNVKENSLVTIDPKDTEKSVKEYKEKTAKVNKLIENTGSTVGNIGDVIASVGYVAAPFTEGGSLLIAAIGEGISSLGALIEHSAKFSKDGATSGNLTDLGVDIVFEIAPAPIENAIKGSGLDKVSKKLLKAEVNKVNKGIEFAVKEVGNIESNKDKSKKQ